MSIQGVTINRTGRPGPHWTAPGAY